jgi:quercetin dioxygenase-like cupin family protein
MSFGVRRIVTAQGPTGASRLGFDSVVASQPGKLQSGVSVASIWMNETVPPRLDGPDPAEQPFPVLPENGGAIFRMLELGPGTAPHMHKTETIDYVVVIAGELTMLLEDGSELRMKPYDVVIQRATVHGWANRGDGPCRFATVVIDAAGKR